MKKKMLALFGMLLMVGVFVLVGCGSHTTDNPEESQSASQGEALADSGTLYLKVNPEIAIDYDEAGLVTEVRGMNDDGERLLEDATDFIGKDSGVVLEELIVLMGEAGYFVEEVDGKSKSIVIELEAGSVLPEEKFVERVAANAQKAVETYKSSSEETSDTNAQVTYEDNTFISLEEAKKIAFDHAGVSGEQANFDDQELDTDDGIPSYELEFNIGADEYGYDIHALTGEVIQFEQDLESGASQSGSETADAERISLEEAKEIALAHAGVNAADANFDNQELDTDDGVPSYELEFNVGNAEYEYDVHAETGDILDFDHDVD